MKGLTKFLVMLIVGTLLVSACAQATEEPANLYEEIQSEGKIVVGTSADYPPFESIDEEGNYVGFDMELIREIGDRMGVEVEIQDMGFDALITALREGKIDAVIASMAPTPEREEKVDFTTEYYVGTQTFLGGADTDITIEEPAEDLVGYKIGVQSATTLEEWVVENLVEPGKVPDGDVLRYERADNAALDLQAGRLDVVFLDSGPAFELADEMGLTELYTANVVQTQGAAIAVPTGEDELRAEMDSIIEDLKAEGYIDQLIEEWLY